LDVDPKRRRISLTMRLDQAPEARPTIARAEVAPVGSDKRLRSAETRAGPSDSVLASGDAMAEAFRRAGLTGKVWRMKTTMPNVHRTPTGRLM
jgi:hypothetical protein